MKKNLNKTNIPIIISGIFILLLFLKYSGNKGQEIIYSDFQKLIQENPGSIRQVVIEDTGGRAEVYLGNSLEISTNGRREEIDLSTEPLSIWGSNSSFREQNKRFVILPKDFTGNQDLVKQLTKAKIKTVIRESKGDLFSLIISGLPFLIFLPLLFIMFRGVQAGGGQAFNFIRNKAKLFGEKNIKITFKDVAGVNEAKKEVEEIVDFLKDSKKYKALGAKIPKGVLLIGPPGTGKTLLARAIAGEAKVPFFSISGSDFVEMFVGVGASRVRDLFQQARKNAPCIIFVDEIDAVGRQRGVSANGHDEREQTLNQLLVEMDGFESNESSIIVLAATNRADVLDSALTRPGRFDRRVTIDLPLRKERKEILKVHARGKPLLGDENALLETVAKRTPGFTGAQLESIMNEGAIIAAREDKTQIGYRELDEAIEKVYLGAKKSISSSFDDLEWTAYHEVGHALVALTDKKMPLYKVTIIPRSSALGVTWSLGKEDMSHWTKKSLLMRIKIALGGICAEEIIYGDTSAGVLEDLRGATEIARQIVAKFGMTKELGPVSYGKDQNFFGSNNDYSEKVAGEIDQQVRLILESCKKSVKTLLTKRRKEMEALVLELLQLETLNKEEVDKIITKVREEKFDFDAAKKRVARQKRKHDLRIKEEDHEEEEKEEQEEKERNKKKRTTKRSRT